MTGADMAVAGMIPSLPRKVFERREPAVLFLLLKKLALCSFRIHHKSRTDLVR